MLPKNKQQAQVPNFFVKLLRLHSLTQSLQLKAAKKKTENLFLPSHP